MLQIMIEPPPRPALLTVEFKNTRPVDLIDLTVGFRALGEAYSDFAAEEGWDIHPDNLRLYVQEIRSGSIIAELAPWMDQASWVLDKATTLAPFATALHAAIKYFLGKEEQDKPPSKALTQNLHALLEPTAKDSGSQTIISVSGGAKITQNVYNFHFNSQQANAAQNSIKRYLGPQVPATQNFEDAILVLHQMRFDGSLGSIDRGIIEAISPRHVKLRFLTPEAKRLIVDTHENPGHMAFLVDGVANFIGGKPALYQIKEVKDAFERP